MTPMLYPNCREPRMAVKTERTKVPVTVCSRKTQRNTHREKKNIKNCIIYRTVCNTGRLVCKYNNGK